MRVPNSMYAARIIQARTWRWVGVGVGVVSTPSAHTYTVYESWVTHSPGCGVHVSFRLVCEWFLLVFDPFSSVTPRVLPQITHSKLPPRRS